MSSTGDLRRRGAAASPLQPTPGAAVAAAWRGWVGGPGLCRTACRRPTSRCHHGRRRIRGPRSAGAYGMSAREGGFGRGCGVHWAVQGSGRRLGGRGVSRGGGATGRGVSYCVVKGCGCESNWVRCVQAAFVVRGGRGAAVRGRDEGRPQWHEHARQGRLWQVRESRSLSLYIYICICVYNTTHV
jgi:hypothetical protein